MPKLHVHQEIWPRMFIGTLLKISKPRNQSSTIDSVNMMYS